jgi:methylmalonyl-CoA/ethylmalonyl-CoA epimerase
MFRPLTSYLQPLEAPASNLQPLQASYLLISSYPNYATNFLINYNTKGGAMKVLKIDHLGIAVNSIDQGKNFWMDVLGLEFEGSETVDEQKVTTAFFPVGESEVELLESTAPDGPIARYLEKKGEGIQHVAFRVENIDSALQELKEKGIRLIDEKPRKGAGGAKIAFLHPKSTNGVLVELCERD